MSGLPAPFNACSMPCWSLLHLLLLCYCRCFSSNYFKLYLVCPHTLGVIPGGSRTMPFYLYCYLFPLLVGHCSSACYATYLSNSPVSCLPYDCAYILFWRHRFDLAFICLCVSQGYCWWSWVYSFCIFGLAKPVLQLHLMFVELQTIKQRVLSLLWSAWVVFLHLLNWLHGKWQNLILCRLALQLLQMVGTTPKFVATRPPQTFTTLSSISSIPILPLANEWNQNPSRNMQSSSKSVHWVTRVCSLPPVLGPSTA